MLVTPRGVESVSLALRSCLGVPPVLRSLLRGLLGLHEGRQLVPAGGTPQKTVMVGIWVLFFWCFGFWGFWGFGFFSTNPKKHNKLWNSEYLTMIMDLDSNSNGYKIDENVYKINDNEHENIEK